MSALGRELLRCLSGTRVVPRLISDHPRPEWRIGPFTAVVGPQRAELRYARESVGWAKPRAEEIIEGMRRAVARLADRSAPPDVLLPALAAAYADLRARPGERVPLVAVRDALAETTRAQFAWDIARLQREHRLVFAGRRIDLGIATGASAMRRTRVVWLEIGGGAGAYYETFRMIPEETTHAQVTTPKTARRAHRRAGATHARADGRER
jgi:hypothetical protein